MAGVTRDALRTRSGLEAIVAPPLRDLSCVSVEARPLWREVALSVLERRVLVGRPDRKPFASLLQQKRVLDRELNSAHGRSRELDLELNLPNGLVTEEGQGDGKRGRVGDAHLRDPHARRRGRVRALAVLPV